MLGSATRTWNTTALFSVEVGTTSDGQWTEAATDKPLPQEVVVAIERAAPGHDWGEIVIPLSSRGYYDPGRIYGDPDKCYPPEGYDERLLDGGAYFWAVAKKFPFTAEESAMLFDRYEQQIHRQEIDTSA